MSNCPSYFPASCSSCSGSSSNACNCGYVIERYDAAVSRWMTIRTNCESNCVAPGGSTLAAGYAYDGMCRLRCCVPGSPKTKYTRMVLYAFVALVVIVLLYWIVRLLFFSEAGQ